MIRFLATNEDGGTVIGLGLSRANVDRLVDGEPIQVDAASVNAPFRGQIFIFFGETEEAMAEELQRGGAIGPQTEVHVDPRLREGGAG